jgi:hypothetical protein
MSSETDRSYERRATSCEFVPGNQQSLALSGGISWPIVRRLTHGHGSPDPQPAARSSRLLPMGTQSSADNARVIADGSKR